MKERILEILKQLEKGEISLEEAYNHLKHLPYYDIGHSKIDFHRRLRKGLPEIIYGEFKDPEKIAEIVKVMLEKGEQVIITRINKSKYEKIKEKVPSLLYNEKARIAYDQIPTEKKGLVAVISAGSSDEAIAEEAAFTCELLGVEVIKIFDAGIAGPHRFAAHLDQLEKADVIIAVAGMEGALPSILAALVSTPIIAVPTSVGYGTVLGGIAPLLTMLNSCSSGIAVVNIDNGVGAAVTAVSICRRIHENKGKN